MKYNLNLKQFVKDFLFRLFTLIYMLISIIVGVIVGIAIVIPFYLLTGDDPFEDIYNFIENIYSEIKYTVYGKY